MPADGWPKPRGLPLGEKKNRFSDGFSLLTSYKTRRGPAQKEV